jgi:thiamine-monophosphate kinase
MNPPESALGEFELIDRFFARRGTARAGKSGVILGIGDDAAVLALPPETELIVSVDTIVARRHFPEGADAGALGPRARAGNFSDIAGLGGTPPRATLALTLPEADAAWLERFAAGFLDLADANGVALVGGDTTRGALTVSVQILGHVPRGAALRRSGARDGDLLAVTGTLGDAGAGLAFTVHPPADASRAALDLIERFEYPAPRVGFGVAARGIATAAMDLSDGLAGDLPKLAHASGLAAHVAVERLPLSDAMRATASVAQALDWALTAGDDYELLLAVPAPRYAELQAAAAQLNLLLTSIGELRSGSGVTWSLNGREFLPASRGYDHFA